MADVDIKVLLANRITLNARAIDETREAIAKEQKPSPEFLTAAATSIAASLAVIDEMQRLWETLGYGFPSLLDVSRTATV